jgi:RNA polymerase sigma-70 factor (ECF subfamily)
MDEEPLSTDAGLQSDEEFAEVYQTYRQPIYRFLLWRTRDEAASDDLTSSVFEKAWRARASFSGGSRQAWLYRIARNALTDHWRRKQTLPLEHAEQLADDTAASDAERLDADQAAAELRTALGQLPGDMRRLVELRFVDGLSAKQVADKLGMTEGNVRVVQYRALKRIRKLLS